MMKFRIHKHPVPDPSIPAQLQAPTKYCLSAVDYDDPGQQQYLHGCGSILTTPEWWPTSEMAQAVLDRYTPKHEWKHGDVFRMANGRRGIHLVTSVTSVVYHIDGQYCVGHADYLGGAKFLFNLKDVVDFRKEE